MSGRDVLALARRHLWLVAAITLLAAGGSYLYSSSQTQQFSATAQLLYEPAMDVSSSYFGYGSIDPSRQELQIQGAVTALTGPRIAQRTREALGSQDLPEYSISAAIVISDEGDGGSGYATGLTVTATSPSREWAAKAANTCASQFIKWRRDSQRASIGKAEAVLQGQLDTLRAGEQQASSTYLMIQERIHDLQLRAATATGDFEVIVPATPPREPFAPRPIRASMLALGVGLVAGTGVSFLRQKLDTRLRSHREISAALDLPAIGRVPRIPPEDLVKSALVVLNESGGPTANAMRLLRSNLEFVSMGQEHRVISLLSALQGEGKSVTVANLATALALGGKSVLLVDADLHRPRLHTIFGLPNRAGVSSMVTGQAKLPEALQPFDLLAARAKLAGTKDKRTAGEPTAASKLWVITAGPIPPNAGEIIASRRFAAVVEELKQLPCDYVLFDTPAFMPIGDSAAVAALCDGIVLLVNIDMARRPLLEDIAEFLGSLPTRALGVVVVGDQTAQGERYHSYREG